MLRECKASVRSQTFRGWEHLVALDRDRDGCSATFNALAEQAQGEWIFILADDDLLLPSCLGRHLAVSANADVVYSPPLVWGEAHDQFHAAPPAIPAAALIRKTWWDRLRGYSPKLSEQEDRDFFHRAQELGAIFVRAEGPAWVYRLGHGGNKSRHNGVST